MHAPADRPTSHLYWIGGLVVTALSLLAACGDPPSDETGGSTPEAPDTTFESELGNYELTVDPAPDDVPFNEYFTLEVTLETAADGEPVDGAELTPEAYVDEFDKPMPSHPTVEAVGEGTYRIEGLLLHVPRPWELVVQVGGDAEADKIEVPLDPVVAMPLPEGASPERFDERELRRIGSMSPEDKSPPASPSNAHADDDKAAHLGQFLFFDEKLSSNENVACATCHQPDEGFSDGRKVSQGIAATDRHAPTILNAVYSRWFFWDGRVDSLWAQALQPFEAPGEHGFDRIRVLRRIAGDDELRTAYQQVFGDLPDLEGLPEQDARPVPGDPEAPAHRRWMEIPEQRRRAISDAYANVGKAIAAYERRLVRNDAPFDTFVEGLRTGDQQKLEAISEEAKQGLKVFVADGGCDLCHGGHQFTNFEFHTLGLGTRSWLPNDDSGRGAGLGQVRGEEFNAIGPYSDADTTPDRHRFAPDERFALQGAFKTPTLRNLTETAPYMHGGHHESLEDVVEFYSDLQKDPPIGRRDALLQPLELNDEQVAALVAFLETLTGKPLPDSLKEQPESPVPPGE